MTTDKTPATLATAKHGGSVQLKDFPSTGGQDALSAQAVWMLPDDARLVGVIADNIERGKLDHPGFYRSTQLAEVLRRMLSAALSAQPSPGGQGDVGMRALAASIGEVAHRLSTYMPHLSEWADRARDCKKAADVLAALAARQPVGEPDHLRGSTEMIGQPVGQISDAQIDARLNALYREMVDSGQHNGGMSGVAWDRAVFRMASKQPAQAVGLGAVRDAVQGITLGFNGDLPYIKGIAEALALIDSQVVRNG
ncbi:hypothetical protein [Stenotrophomonas lactitubi]|uniref:hypothetical protein n=1 Tax=Stenotrophomonas lactitubi TaxID=2045214 RepID=UPI003875EAA6